MQDIHGDRLFKLLTDNMDTTVDRRCLFCTNCINWGRGMLQPLPQPRPQPPQTLDLENPISQTLIPPGLIPENPVPKYSPIRYTNIKKSNAQQPTRVCIILPIFL